MTLLNLPSWTGTPMVPSRSKAAGRRNEIVFGICSALEDDGVQLVFEVSLPEKAMSGWVTLGLSVGESVIAPIATGQGRQTFALVTLQREYSRKRETIRTTS